MARLLLFLLPATIFAMPAEFDDPSKIGWPFPPKDPDIGKPIDQLVADRGFLLEAHTATTIDGYILTLHRISRRDQNSPVGEDTNGDSPARGPPVLLVHCLLCSSFDFVNNMPDQSLAFVLASKGFDVWLGNNRGNVFSKRHSSIDVNSAVFWDFSWDEMAKFDVPAFVEYILNATGYEKLSYIGHSEGTTQAFAAFSLTPGLADRVNLFVALAPATFVSHSKSPIFSLLSRLDIAELFQIFGVREFLASDSIINRLSPFICRTIPMGCDVSLYLFCGASNHINATRIQVYVSQTPAGTSVKNMVHWSQQMRTDGFTMYDYGSRDRNLDHYGSATPPPYDLSAITVPMVLYSGGHDILVEPADLSRLLSQLPPARILAHNHIDTWAHLDFAWTFEGQAVYADVAEWVAKAAGGTL